MGKPTGNILDDFISGGRKGMNMALFNLTPNFVMAYILIYILTSTGIMNLVANLFNPIMGIFGLPGEAGTVLITGWLSCPGGMAAMTALAGEGVLNGYQVAIMIPMIYSMGGQIQYTGRILNVVKTPGKYFFPIYIIGFICAIVIGLLMRVVVGFF